MTVRELIAFLQTQPQDIQVVYSCFSEQALMEVSEITIIRGCAARDDGWVQNARPDKPSCEFLAFPGN